MQAYPAFYIFEPTLNSTGSISDDLNRGGDADLADVMFHGNKLSCYYGMLPTGRILSFVGTHIIARSIAESKKIAIY